MSKAVEISRQHGGTADAAVRSGDTTCLPALFVAPGLALITTRCARVSREAA